MVFIQFPFGKKIHCIDSREIVLDSFRIHHYVSSYLGSKDFCLSCNGKIFADGQEIFHDDTIHVTLSLPGGKGGFGSMLRAIGAQIEKTTNREACRDLSGRRLRDINEEQRLKKWLAKKAEREAEKEQRHRARIERLKSKPKHNFVDIEFEREISVLPERIDDALTAGMQKASKRPMEEGESSKVQSKKKCMWLDEDLSASSESESESSGIKSSTETSKCDLNNEEKNNLPEILNSEASETETSSSSSTFDTKRILIEQCNISMEQSSGISTEEMSLEDDFVQKQSSSSSDLDKPIISNATIQKQTSSNISGLEGSGNLSSITDPTSSENGIDPSEQHVSSGILNENKSSVIGCQEDDAPIDLLAFSSAAELECLGLDRLKLALMARGLKCGGNISDRAQRLWRVRGLKPEEYPASFLAKKKK